MFVKGEKIYSVGFSKKLCGSDRAFCIAQAPGAQDVFDWTARTAAFSAKFASASSTIIAGSIGCSHLNQYLHSMNWVRPDKATYFAADLVLEELCGDGLHWSMVSHRVAARYPKLATIMSKALNVEHHVGEGETWLQQLRQIATMVTSEAIMAIDRVHIDDYSPYSPYSSDLQVYSSPALYAPKNPTLTSAEVAHAYSP
jgi:hypothetical protein